MPNKMQDSHPKVESGTTHHAGGTRDAPLILDAEAIAALNQLGNALAAVHRRLISEGYVIEKGRYVAPTDDR